jgi:hypothetical protein
MQTMEDTYQTKGLTVVAVNLDRDHNDAQRFLAKFHPSFDVRFASMIDVIL